jgi:hypothetical protein
MLHICQAQVPIICRSQDALLAGRQLIAHGRTHERGASGTVGNGGAGFLGSRGGGGSHAKLCTTKPWQSIPALSRRTGRGPAARYSCDRPVSAMVAPNRVHVGPRDRQQRSHRQRDDFARRMIVMRVPTSALANGRLKGLSTTQRFWASARTQPTTNRGPRRRLDRSRGNRHPKATG